MHDATKKNEPGEWTIHAVGTMEYETAEIALWKRLRLAARVVLGWQIRLRFQEINYTTE